MSDMEIVALKCPCQRLTEKPKILEIRDSAKNGCQYCQILRDCIDQFSQVLVEDQRNLVADSHLDFVNGYIQVDWKGFSREYFQLSTVEDEDHGWNAIVQRNPIAQPGSLASLDNIRSWIEECTAQHPLCGHREGVVSQSPKLPRRVLKISCKERNGAYTVSLYENPGGVARYTALSHCWGKKQPLTTTTSTLQSRILGIEWSSLPKTFQQAIDITYGLDVQYIWIDSLCIVQDDREDWARESAVMGAIYENSWVTIAAAAAPDGTYGCHPAPPKQREYKIQKIPEGEKSTIYAQQFSSPRDDKNHIMFIDESLPLFQRTWVLQERLLAPRILQMCEREMVWDCTTNVSCECSGPYEDQLTREDHGISYGGIKYRYNSTLCPQNRLYSKMAVMEFWDHVLYHYCRRNLTFSNDRLPALSGLVEKFQQTEAGGRYFAGLWEKWLPQGLLWFIDPSGDPCPEGRATDIPAAPSWSWASVEGPWRCVRLPLDTPPTSRLLHAVCSLASSDPRGAVLGGRITLSGPVTSASIEFTPSDPAEDYATRFRKQKVKLTKGDLKANTHMDFVLDSAPSPLVPGETVQCIQIQLDFDLPASFGIPRHCHGLILRPSRICGSSYERVGTFLASQKWFDGSLVEIILIV